MKNTPLSALLLSLASEFFLAGSATHAQTVIREPEKTAIPGGTRTTTWILYGQAQTGSNREFEIRQTLHPLDQVTWYAQESLALVQSPFGSSTGPLTRLNVLVDDKLIENGLAGSQTVNQAGILRISFDAHLSDLGRDATYVVSFPPQAGVVINRCEDATGRPMRCP